MWCGHEGCRPTSTARPRRTAHASSPFRQARVLGTYLLDADTGAVLATINNGSRADQLFPQPVFADQYLLLTSTFANRLDAYTP
jgi:hypothetical protein